MNARQRISALLQDKRPDRPAFCPAIYEHKARLINKTPAAVAQSAELLCDAVLAEYECYQPDMLTIGIDIYNIEVEAMGAKITFPTGSDSVPVISTHVMKTAGELGCLKAVKPQTSGRMPLMLDAAQAVNKDVGQEVFVRGAISGPFSIAAGLMGIEPLIMAAALEPESIKGLLNVCTDAAVDYGKAFLKRGVEVCIFDSQTAPPLVSPAMYTNLILPQIQRLIKELHDCGAQFVEYVVGGDTGVNAANIITTDADIVLSDFVSDADAFIKSLQGKKTLLRRNISPILIEMGSEEEIERQVREVVRLAQKHSNVIVGTGVLSYRTPIEKIKLTKSICLKEF